MKSPLPKVLHPVAGIPMIYGLLRAVKLAGSAETRVVVGHGADLVQRIVEPLGGLCFLQQNQKGTADAVQSAKPEDLQGTILVLNGDHPLISSKHIQQILTQFSDSQADLSVVTCIVDDPGHYGRIIRHYGQLKAIVEAKDASQETLKINEINVAIYVAKAEIWAKYLPKIQAGNKQNEYYLTDIVEMCLEDKKLVEGIQVEREVAMGVNDQSELAQVSKEVFCENIKNLMDAGVIVIDPNNTYVESEVQVGQGTVLYPGVYLKGKTEIGPLCVIEPNCFIHASKVAEGSHIKAGSYFEEAIVDKKCTVGPYARLREGTELGEGVVIGNFVETKKAKFAKGSKAKHLSYLGDASIGENTNIGCGTITCNYAIDKKKYRTKIGSNVFVGSNTQFVAPVEIGNDSFIGSGSTITKDVPDRALAVARGRQFIKEEYQIPEKKLKDN